MPAAARARKTTRVYRGEQNKGDFQGFVLRNGTRSPLRGLRCNATKLLRPFILLTGFVLFAWVNSCGKARDPQ